VNQIKQLAGQTLVYGLGTIIPRFLNYLFLTPFYTRIFTGPDDFGIYTKLYAYSAFLIVLLTFGTETSFFRFAKQHGSPKVFTNTLFFIFITGFIAIFGIGFNVEGITSVLNINNAEIAVWLVLGIVLSDIFMSLPFARLRYENKAKLFSILKISNIVLNIGFNLFFFFVLPALSHIELFNLIYYEGATFEYAFASNLLANLVTILLLIPSYRFQLKYLDKKLLITLFLYSYPIVISGLAGMINDVGDKFILDYFITDKEAANYAIGIYGANYKIATLMIIFIQMFKFGVEPFFFRISDQTDHKGTYAFVTKSFSYIGLFLFVAVIGYIDIVKYFIDERYHVGLTIVPFVLLGNFFYGIYYNVSIWYKITDKTRFGMYFTFTGAIITIGTLILLVPKYGYLGAAIATLICFTSMAIINVLMGRKHYKVNYDWKKILGLLAISLLLVTLFWIVRSDNLILSLVFGTVIIFVYLASLFVIDKTFFKTIRSKSV
jgi:O-antigen/teichoic acid export membrane protein